MKLQLLRRIPLSEQTKESWSVTRILSTIVFQGVPQEMFIYNPVAYAKSED